MPEGLDEVHYRGLLDARGAQLRALEEDSAQTRETVVLDQQRVGRVSRMDAMQQQEMAKESGRRRQAELVRIGSALQRMDNGEYGCCLRCDELIAPARLEIAPSATLCIQCAQAAQT
ncbi:MAG: DnaK suppressor protein [Gammaproteobacteria bacterium]|jgi:DnaK suppressor protein